MTPEGMHVEKSRCEIIAERLTLLMQRDRVTGYKVALSTGLSHQAVYSFCSGQRSPSSASLCLLADFFGVSTDYLLGRGEP